MWGSLVARSQGLLSSATRSTSFGSFSRAMATKPKPKLDMVPLFLDMSAHNAVGAVLRWCDVSQMVLFESLEPSQDRTELVESWERASVTRVNKLEVLVRGQAWESTFSALGGFNSWARVRPALSKLGRTSWTVNFEVGTSGEKPLARVESVIVAVDPETLSKSVPVPKPELLKSLIYPDQQPVDVPKVCEKPANAFVWKVQARPSDCDLLGHVNNVVYATLMEDARRAAAEAGAVPQAAGDARLLMVEYNGQAKALDDLEVAVWWDDNVKALGFETSFGGAVATRGVVVLWPAGP